MWLFTFPLKCFQDWSIIFLNLRSKVLSTLSGVCHSGWSSWAYRGPGRMVHFKHFDFYQPHVLISSRHSLSRSLGMTASSGLLQLQLWWIVPPRFLEEIVSPGLLEWITSFGVHHAWSLQENKNWWSIKALLSWSLYFLFEHLLIKLGFGSSLQDFRCGQSSITFGLYHHSQGSVLDWPSRLPVVLTIILKIY